MRKNYSYSIHRSFFGILLFGAWCTLTGAASGRVGCIGYNVQEGCTPGETRTCFQGPDSKKDVGTCKSGTQTCQPERIWSACEGQVIPQPKDSCNGTDDNCDGLISSTSMTEICNGVDDNCDGKIDEGDSICPTGQRCTGFNGCQGQTTGPSTLSQGPFQSSAHPTQGTAKIVKEGDKLFVELGEDFKTDPGPDLKVYLTADTVGDANKGAFLSLGPLTSVTGKQRYEITLQTGQTIETYKAVSIWCEAFQVIFGYATLNP
ncbi:MAG: DM13 domain-containing protein [Myxococcales bacterium]|nr:DM13 domain-containing protein [Myxococcales bacterium]